LLGKPTGEAVRVAFGLRQRCFAKHPMGHRHRVLFEEVGGLFDCPCLDLGRRMPNSSPALIEMLQDDSQSNAEPWQFPEPRLEHAGGAFFEGSGFLPLCLKDRGGLLGER
jgi:hypothetical protein